MKNIDLGSIDFDGKLDEHGHLPVTVTDVEDYTSIEYIDRRIAIELVIHLNELFQLNLVTVEIAKQLEWLSAFIKKGS